MPNHIVNVGAVELISLNDNLPVRSPFVAFPHTTIEQWMEYPELMADHENARHRWGSLAVRSSGKLIIVDTGMQGEDCYLLDDMQAKGIDREAVDLVVFTHVHPDHVGWNYTDGKPNFPNARFLVPQKDWDYWTQPDVINTVEYVVPQVLPLQEHGVMDLMDGEFQITPELTAYPTPGHTPGHNSIRVTSNGEHAFILGDVAHRPITPIGARSSTSTRTWPGPPDMRLSTCWKPRERWCLPGTSPTLALAISSGEKTGGTGRASSLRPVPWLSAPIYNPQSKVCPIKSLPPNSCLSSAAGCV